MKSKTVIYLYNQFMDPVIQSNILLYITDIAAQEVDNHHFAFLTFESPGVLKSGGEMARIKSDLARMNIDWHPCQWHPGTSLFLKLIDLTSSFLKVFQLRLKGYKTIISLASVAGSYAYILSMLFRMRLFLYQYEPHSEYEVDSGTYDRSSWKFKILNFLEERSARHATVISSGTRHMLERLKKWQVKAKVFRIPSVVNEDKFLFSMNDRNEIRSKYGIASSRIVLFYPGKFGGLYYKREIIDMFKILLDKNPGFHALIVTPNDLGEIKTLFLNGGVPEQRLTITQSSYHDIHRFFSAADFGIIAVPPGPSKKFVSNIKVGEYLCSGLPYLICRGVSEDDEVAEKFKVGFVIENFDKNEIEKAYSGIVRILQSPPEYTRNHCRQVGEDYRGFRKLNREFRKAFDSLIHP